MIGFTGFHVLSNNDMEALVTIAADGGSVHSVKYEHNTTNLGRPCLAAVIIEIKINPHPPRHSAVAVYCSKKEAKRLIYPKTNRDKGLCHWVPGDAGGPKRDATFSFADSFDAAMVFIDRETKYINVKNASYGRSCEPQLGEYERIRGYLLKQKKWPALIVPVRSFNPGLLYFLVVDKDMAHRLVYANKSKSARGLAKGEFVMTSGSVTGRITSRTVDDNSARRLITSDDMRAGTDRDLSRVVRDYTSHYDRPSNDEEEVGHDSLDEEVNEVCDISEELADSHVDDNPTAPHVTHNDGVIGITMKELRRRRRIKRDLEAAEARLAERGQEGPDFSAALRGRIEEERAAIGRAAAERMGEQASDEVIGEDEIMGDIIEGESNTAEEFLQASDEIANTISRGTVPHDLTSWNWYDRPAEPTTTEPTEEEEEPEEN